MKDFFTIGELADLFAIDVQTLRYYDKIGLLIPSHRNHANGYRLYKFDQVYQVASIRYLKRLGYSLEQIREYLDSRTLDHTIERLQGQSALLKQRWQELISIDSAIQRKIEFIKVQLPQVSLQEVQVKTFPDRYYLDIGSEEILTDLMYSISIQHWCFIGKTRNSLVHTSLNTYLMRQSFLHFMMCQSSKEELSFVAIIRVRTRQ